MTVEIPENKPEKEKTEVLEDNARKFVIEPINESFLEENSASSCELIVDWLETGEDTETKLVHKDFGNGNIQILLISKTTNDGNRTSEKKKITEEEYKQRKKNSILHLEKKRYEFTYAQNGTVFSVKCDRIEDGVLYMMEVDAPTKAERESFDPAIFPIESREVAGPEFDGYRVCQTLEAFRPSQPTS